jgi:hypothetical protein
MLAAMWNLVIETIEGFKNDTLLPKDGWILIPRLS